VNLGPSGICAPAVAFVGEPVKPARMLTRRRFLAAGGALAAAGAGDAFLIEPRWLDVSEHRIEIAGLSPSLDGFTIAHVTDAHLSAFGVTESSVVAAVRRVAAQVVVLSGDIVDDAARLPLLGGLLDALAATGAELVASLGNWEHWAGFEPRQLREYYDRFGARLLVNDAAHVSGVVIAATDDGYVGAPRWNQTLASLAQLARQDAPRILLSHSPALLDARAPDGARFDLALAGHTHGGQLRAGPFAPLVPPGSGRFVAGFYDTPLGRAYVSRGTGTSIVPARFGCRPELPIFRLARG
jgi:uncharacterized protein